MDREVINWESCLEMVEQDEDFLREIFSDFFEEAREAREKMRGSLPNSSWENVRQASHRVKGSSSYLCCEQLAHCCARLQEMSEKAMNGPDDIASIRSSIEELFEEYCTCIDLVHQRYDKRFGK